MNFNFLVNQNNTKVRCLLLENYTDLKKMMPSNICKFEGNTYFNNYGDLHQRLTFLIFFSFDLIFLFLEIYLEKIILAK